MYTIAMRHTLFKCFELKSFLNVLSFNVPLVFAVILSLTVKLPYDHLVIQQKCMCKDVCNKDANSKSTWNLLSLWKSSFKFWSLKSIRIAFVLVNSISCNMRLQKTPFDLVICTNRSSRVIVTATLCFQGLCWDYTSSQ